jgi:hypothetical protein
MFTAIKNHREQKKLERQMDAALIDNDFMDAIHLGHENHGAHCEEDGCHRPATHEFRATEKDEDGVSTYYTFRCDEHVDTVGPEMQEVL